MTNTRKLLRLIASLVFLGALVSASSGQSVNKDESSNDCPDISVVGPPAVIKPGETMKFRAEVSDVDPNLELGFEWSVDKGTIIEGEEELAIVVGETDDLGGQTIKAVVRITGLESNCKNSFSDTGIVSAPLAWETIDEFGKLANDDLKARADNLMINLQSYPMAKGYFLTYGPADEVEYRNWVIREHLKSRKYDLDRFILQNRGKESDIRTRVWIVPAGADLSKID